MWWSRRVFCINTEKNGYKISEFTPGAVQLGIPYGINNKSRMPSYERSAKILQTVIDDGFCLNRLGIRKIPLEEIIS